MWGLPIYERFEQAVFFVLTALIALVVVAPVWTLLTSVVGGLILAGSFDPTDHRVFQSLFGMILTVIIALEFKRSILIVGERQFGIVQVRAVILIALGVALVIAGLLWPVLSQLGLGSLPGDVVIEREGLGVSIPIATSILISLVLSTAFWFLGR